MLPSLCRRSALLLAILCFHLFSAHAITYVVSTTAETGAGSLREAITLANANVTATAASPHLIDASGITGFIDLVTALPGLANHITFQGPSAGTLTIRRISATNFRIFYINPGFTITMNRLTISNGNDGGGGGIYNAGSTLNVSNCRFVDNKTISSAAGGAIGSFNNGNLTITNTSFETNSSSGSGAAVSSSGGTVQISGSTFFNNTAFYDGAAVYGQSNSGSITLDGCTITNNTSTNGSGSVYSRSTLNISNTLIKGNAANNTGGVWAQGGTASIISSTIDSNKANNNGGGIEASTSSITIQASTISRNTSVNGAGGIEVFSGSLSLTNCTISFNQSIQSAGGIYNSSSPLTLLNCTVTKNNTNSTLAGGMHFGGTNNNLSNTIVIGNTSTPSVNLNDIAGTSSVFSSNGHNIFGVVGYGVTFTGNTTTNIIGVAPNTVVSPSLANNGGPTKTHALVNCSYAINAGTRKGAPATDQTGAARPAADSLDIGAFESPLTNGAVFITGQPSSINACNSGTSFSTIVPGKGVNYQWQVNTGSGFTNVINGGVYSNATTSKLQISNVTGMNGYQYRCIVTGPCSTVLTSSSATLTVDSTPVLSTQPSDINACAGSYPSFIVVSSNALSYQWQVDNGGGFSNIPLVSTYNGSTTASLQVNAPGSGLDGSMYRCVVSNTCGSVNSSAATLTVSTTPSITNQPFNQSTCTGGSASFSIATMGSGNSFQWQVNEGSGFTAITDGGIYSGATTPLLNLTGPTSSMNGNSYRCVVNNPCTNVTSTAATLTITSGVTFTTQPSNQTICPNAGTSFTIAATGATGYQWEVNTGSGYTAISDGGVYSNATTAALTLTGASSGMSGYQYRCIVNSSACPAGEPSGSATLNFITAPVITKHPSDQGICSGGTITLSTLATGATGYQWQVNTGSGFTTVTNGGVYSNATTNALTITGVTAAMEGYQYRGVAVNSCTNSTNTNAATLTSNAAVSISAHPSPSLACNGGNTSFSVTATGPSLAYQWQVDKGTGFTTIINGGVYSNATTNTLTLTSITSAYNGYKYRCVVSASACTTTSSTSNAATLSLKTYPTINAQPASKNSCSGGNATFTVGASGDITGYQWHINQSGLWTPLTDGGMYSGVTTPTLTVTGATTSLQFRCYLSQSCSSTQIASATANLQINTATTIATQPIDKSICAGTGTTFSVAINGGALTYQWQADAGMGFTDLSNAGVYSDVTTATLSLTGVTASMEGYMYRCIVTGCTGNITSNPATLSVTPGPVITSQPKDSTACMSAPFGFKVTATGNSLTYKWQMDQGSGFADITSGVYSGVTTNTLTGSMLQANYEGYKYRVLISQPSCNANVSSNIATLHVKGLEGMTSSNPSLVTVCENGNAMISFAPIGNGLSYKWEFNRNDGTDWEEVAEGAMFSNTTTPSLSITGALASMDTYGYKCRIMTSGCNPYYTSTTELDVQGPVSLNMEPQDAATCNGGDASFSVNASGGTINYQWQENSGSGFSTISDNGIYSNTSGATLTITGADPSMNNYMYRCIVSPAVCTQTPSITTSPAKLGVTATGVIISAQPKNKIGYVNNGTASFSVEAIGNFLSYQWMRNTGSGYSAISDDNDFEGTTTSNLTVKNISSSMNMHQFRCDITGACGISVPSSGAKLIVLDPSICMVSFDGTLGKNMIVFEKPSDLSSVQNYVIYKEGIISNQFTELGRVAKSSFSTFTDNSSNPAQQADIYKIAIEDTSGTISPLSSPHKTMHLTINKGPNSTTWNLIWTPYQGINVATYNIYRGLSPTSLSYLGSVSGSLTSYTDLSAPSASNIYYQIEIVGPACNPSARIAALNSIRSNIAETQFVTSVTSSYHDASIKLYPNPAKELVILEGLTANSQVSIYTVTGIMTAFTEVNATDGQLNTNKLEPGLYIVEIKMGDKVIRKLLTIE